MKSNVPAAHMAETILVPATTGDDVVMFLVPADAAGVTAVRQETMNHEPLFELALDGVRVGDDAVLGGSGQGREILAWSRSTA